MQADRLSSLLHRRKSARFDCSDSIHNTWNTRDTVLAEVFATHDLICFADPIFANRFFQGFPKAASQVHVVEECWGCFRRLAVKGNRKIGFCKFGKQSDRSSFESIRLI